MASSSPSPVAEFEGESFDDVRARDGRAVVPPDPSIAVGRQDIVAIDNGVIEWRSKDGTLLQATPTAFGSQAGASALISSSTARRKKKSRRPS